MSLTKQHELHARRKTRNIGLGLTLAAFVAIVLGMTVVKISSPSFQMQPEAAANGN